MFPENLAWILLFHPSRASLLDVGRRVSYHYDAVEGVGQGERVTLTLASTSITLDTDTPLVCLFRYLLFALIWTRAKSGLAESVINTVHAAMQVSCVSAAAWWRQ